ncbi:DUF2782 domain-containing protein [Luteimonas sp. S4-F44]|jgi:outer membrane biogenesis lipoprotein LolB|uniref:DUF2782 domain-containing protein n=1 Tax=unclassified Luteimonas TaxID=2629088 RepID=UPI001F53AF9E|nr:DUF2782 domain-containing protein [Luteimonas sp. S4-F44]UNK42804.1 DUF2782 domain-containing protein [Luteimonas sp. S4-F44]
MSASRTAVLAIALLGLSACASPGGALPDGIPADAEQVTRTESNGDRITEFRVAGQLRAVQVVPSRGPAYFLYDRDGDGSIDSDRDDVPQTYFKLFGW